MAISLDESVHQDPEAKMTQSGRSVVTGKGGWVTFPFILGTIATMVLASTGWSANLTVYLIEKFNVDSIDAAQIVNIVSGFSSFSPLLGAILADSLLGSFAVIAISAIFTFLGLVFLALSALLLPNTLRSCQIIGSSSLCETPSTLSFTFLYTGIVLACIGGSSRYTTSTMGANQFDIPNDRNIFFNWYCVVSYAGTTIASTAVVYIQDDVGWTVGFGVCIACSVLALAIFFAGSSLYRRDKPEGSPFTFLARVVVAAIRKRNVELSRISEGYEYEHLGVAGDCATAPTKRFRFFNRAALVTEGDVNPDGSIAKPWRLCTVQQVEDLKALFKIFPLWSSNILLATTLAIMSTFAVLQVLLMDRCLGKHFTISAGSITVIILLSCCLFLLILDRVLNPVWKALTGQWPSRFQQIGAGHVINVLSMVTAAIVEYERLKLEHDSAEQMSALWLFPQLILGGIAEAFYVSAQLGLYYQEFPESLRNTSTATLALILAVSSYIAAGLIELVRSTTTWLPDNLNDGRLDYFFWVAAGIGVINFGYFLICAKLYKYQYVEKEAIENSSNPDE